MVVALDRSPEAAVAEIVSAARAHDPALAIGRVRAYDDIVRSTLRPQRFRALVLTGFGAATLILVTLGMYGATAHAVQRRRRELALRTALGAEPQRLLRLTVRDAVVTIAAGSLVGLALTWVGGRLVRNMLYAVTSADPAAVVTGLGLTAAAVLFASWIPARQVAWIDPAEVLKHE